MTATITSLPTPPSRSDPTNFAARGDAFMAALPQFVEEVNALVTALGLIATQTVLATVGTMAALRAMPAPVGPATTLLMGYYSAGDLGGVTSMYRWDAGSSATDDGGAVIRPNALPATGRWILMPSVGWTVKQFGAKGDWDDDTQSGTADDAAFDNWYAACNTYKQRALMPAANYKWASSGKVWNKSVDAQGMDWARTRIICAATTGIALTIDGSGQQSRYEDFNIEGSNARKAAASAGAIGIKLISISHGTVHRVGSFNHGGVNCEIADTGMGSTTLAEIRNVMFVGGASHGWQLTEAYAVNASIVDARGNAGLGTRAVLANFNTINVYNQQNAAGGSKWESCLQNDVVDYGESNTSGPDFEATASSTRNHFVITHADSTGDITENGTNNYLLDIAQNPIYSMPIFGRIYHTLDANGRGSAWAADSAGVGSSDRTGGKLTVTSGNGTGTGRGGHIDLQTGSGSVYGTIHFQYSGGGAAFASDATVNVGASTSVILGSQTRVPAMPFLTSAERDLLTPVEGVSQGASGPIDNDTTNTMQVYVNGSWRDAT